MDLDLAHQLLFGAGALEGALVDDLGRRDSLRLALDKLVALGKASLAEELALDVLAVGDLAILVLHTLLNDLRAVAPLATCRVQVRLAAARLRRR